LIYNNIIYILNKERREQNITITLHIKVNKMEKINISERKQLFVIPTWNL